jgi:hypothetical protein
MAAEHVAIIKVESNLVKSYVLTVGRLLIARDSRKHQFEEI